MFQSLESDLIYDKSEYSKIQRETSQVRKMKNSYILIQVIKGIHVFWP